MTVCDGTDNFDEPSFFGEDCELLGVSFADQIFTVVPDACFKIERTWSIINWYTFNPNLPFIEVLNPTPNATANSAANLPGPTVSECGTLPPWKSTVVKVGFYLPEAAEATLSIVDESGRVMYQQKGQFAKGEHSIQLDAGLVILQGTGLLFYKLETETDTVAVPAALAAGDALKKAGIMPVRLRQLSSRYYPNNTSIVSSFCTRLAAYSFFVRPKVVIMVSQTAFFVSVSVLNRLIFCCN